MKKNKEKKFRKKEVNLTTIQLNTKKFVLGPLWHEDEKQKRRYRHCYVSR